MVESERRGGVMFSRQEIKKNLLGCFEIVLFMAKGVERFSESRQAAIKSFAVPLLLVPVALLITSVKSTGYPVFLLVALHGARFIITYSLFMIIVYFLTQQIKRQEHFYQFVNAYNWLAVPSTLLILPILVALTMGLYTWEELEQYAIFTVLVSYVFSAFIMTHALRIPWEMGGFVAIVGMCIDQTALSIFGYVRDALAA